MSTSIVKNPVPELRQRVIDFLRGKENVDMGAIKEHLKMEPFKYSNTLEKALRSKKIAITRAHPEIGKLGDNKLFAATPIRLFSLA